MAIFDILSTVAKVLKEAGKIDLYEKMIDTKQDILNMQNKISEQDDTIRQLKVKLDVRKKLVFERNSCWELKTDGTKIGPFCSRCAQKDGEMIRLHFEDRAHFRYFCPQCKTPVEMRE